MPSEPVIATELKHILKWLGDRVRDDFRTEQLFEDKKSEEGICDDDDDIEDWQIQKMQIISFFLRFMQLLSNGRFKNADHQAMVNSNCSHLSIATFQNPALEAKVYPLKVVREGEKPILDEPITFAEIYRRKMSKDIELARLKKLAKDKNILDSTLGD